MTTRTIRSTGCCRTRWPCRSSPAATWACVDGVCTRCSPTPATTRSPPSTGADPKGAPWTPEPNREASQVGLGVIEERICALARYYAELGIEPPSKVEAKPQDFETQVRAVIDAGVPVLSFIYGIPPSEILDECRRRKIKTIGTATAPEEASA